MKGIAHLTLSLATLLTVLAPFAPDFFNIESIPYLIIVLLAAFIGCLTPDIDAGRCSAIFHSHIPGAKGKRLIITPFFGYLICYSCYYPIRKLFVRIFGDKIYAKAGHRELPHSPIGCLCISVLLTAYIWIICALLSFIPPLASLFNNSLIYVFGCTFFLGCLLHLIEDTCDNSGIHYLYPFSFSRLRGELLGNSTDIKPWVYAAILFCTAGGLITAAFTGLIPETGKYISAIIAPCILWALFLRVSGCPAQKKQRDIYQKK